MDTQDTSFEDAELDELLGGLSEKHYKFFKLMDTGKYTQTEAYREAFDRRGGLDSSVASDACRLRNSPKFKQIRILLKNTIVEQSARSLDFRIAEMEAFANRAEQAGAWSSAVKARENVAKLEGHYVIKTQRVASKTDELDLLKDVCKDKSAESIAFAMKEAKALGLEKELTEYLGSKAVH